MAQIPCVVVDVMRGGPSTGLPTEPAQGDVMQARWGTHGEHSVIALVPSSVEECYTLTIQAFNLARAVPHAGHRPHRRADRPHARGRRVARARQPAHRRARHAGLRAGRVRHDHQHAGQHPAASASRLALQGPCHRARLQPPQRGAGHERPGRRRRPRPLPAREDLPPPRRDRPRGGGRDGRRRGRDLRLRLRRPLGARGGPRGPRPGRSRRPRAARSPCGRSRRRRWSAWPSRCARSSCPR